MTRYKWQSPTPMWIYFGLFPLIHIDVQIVPSLPPAPPAFSWWRARSCLSSGCPRSPRRCIWTASRTSCSGRPRRGTWSRAVKLREGPLTALTWSQSWGRPPGTSHCRPRPRWWGAWPRRWCRPRRPPGNAASRNPDQVNMRQESSSLLHQVPRYDVTLYFSMTVYGACSYPL